MHRWRRQSPFELVHWFIRVLAEAVTDVFEKWGQWRFHHPGLKPMVPKWPGEDTYNIYAGMNWRLSRSSSCFEPAGNCIAAIPSVIPAHHSFGFIFKQVSAVAAKWCVSWFYLHHRLLQTFIIAAKTVDAVSFVTSGINSVVHFIRQVSILSYFIYFNLYRSVSIAVNIVLFFLSLPVMLTISARKR